MEAYLCTQQPRMLPWAKYKTAANLCLFVEHNITLASLLFFIVVSSVCCTNAFQWPLLWNKPVVPLTLAKFLFLTFNLRNCISAAQLFLAPKTMFKMFSISSNVTEINSDCCIFAFFFTLFVVYTFIFSITSMMIYYAKLNSLRVLFFSKLIFVMV